ncbi:hypothetical protein [Nitrospirillum sp. BR 11163]|uniref:hypothetical protein n=1 Tax=Nitrospirillum sp. BR 11163 TaxID=3104323 RepID=UPI002AFF15AF|nr:hypothetical protein [Nitrospirillum sp. BR 11163]MEA1672128.1 hypothetical protein [Nitrospirillum sp. BR 11163]
MVKIYGADNKELMTVASIKGEGDTLVIKGKIFGAMPMTAKIRPEEARALLKMLNPRLVLFLLAFLFKPAAGKSAQ